MSTVSTHINDHKATLVITGRFDFSIHRDFRANYEQILEQDGVRELAVDMKDIDYVDSSALGMLLLLREKFMARNIQVTLANPQSPVRQVLDIANFERLFTISQSLPCQYASTPCVALRQQSALLWNSPPILPGQPA